MVRGLEKAKTMVRSYVKLRSFALLLVLAVLLTVSGVVPVIRLGGMSFLPSKKDEETTMAAAEETESFGEVTEIIVGHAWATSECADGETMYAVYAFDGSLATSWQEGAEGYGIGEVLAASFAQSQVTELLFVNGNTSSEESFYRNGRVKLVTVYVPDTSNEWSFEIPDGYNPDGTVLTLDGPVATEVLAFRIDEVYEGEVYQDTCISEIKIYGRVKN